MNSIKSMKIGWELRLRLKWNSSDPKLVPIHFNRYHLLRSLSRVNGTDSLQAVINTGIDQIQIWRLFAIQAIILLASLPKLVSCRDDRPTRKFCTRQCHGLQLQLSYKI